MSCWRLETKAMGSYFTILNTSLFPFTFSDAALLTSHLHLCLLLLLTHPSFSAPFAPFSPRLSTHPPISIRSLTVALPLFRSVFIPPTPFFRPHPSSQQFLCHPHPAHLHLLFVPAFLSLSLSPGRIGIVGIGFRW